MNCGSCPVALPTSGLRCRRPKSAEPHKAAEWTPKVHRIPPRRNDKHLRARRGADHRQDRAGILRRCRGQEDDCENGTWVRNVSFAFRSSPLADSPEMYELHSEDPALDRPLGVTWGSKHSVRLSRATSTAANGPSWRSTWRQRVASGRTAPSWLRPVNRRGVPTPIGEPSY
jgi:hypothetical protein